jgi:membrane protein YdbS with pleckstrin-like domain
VSSTSFHVPATIELGVRRSLDPRVIDLQRTVRWITTACLAGPSFIVVAATSLIPRAPFPLKLAFWGGWLAFTMLLAWFAQKWPPIAYRYASYTVDEHGIEIRRGVVWRSVTNVPRTRVQHTDVSQGPLERSHGLGTLVIHTAGTEHAIVALHGLEHGTALALRNHLLPGGAVDAV